MNFKTAEFHDPGVGGTGSPIKITGYMNSVSNIIGSNTVNGIETPFDSYPEGTLSFSGQQFNMVMIELPFIANGAQSFLIDNVVVVTA